MKQTKAKLKNTKPKQGETLHHFIASGGDPANYEGCKGVDSTTVPGYSEKGEKGE